jgi:hypothetical protein
MPEDQNLGCQRRSRPEQPDQHRPNKAAGFLHRTERLRDSASVVSPIEFTTGTPAKKTPEPGRHRSDSYVFTSALPRRLSFRHDNFSASACLLPKLNLAFQAQTVTARDDDTISKHNH